MSRSSDRMTRTTRDAANIAAAAVVVYAVLWLLSTQVSSIRAVSPFQVDPWDAFATYAAIFLPFVAGPTWVRSLRHRETVLPATIAARIRWGSGLASALVLVAAGTAAEAIATIGFDRGTGIPAALLTALVWASIGLSITAVVLTIRAASVAGRGSTQADASEPDIVDDVLGLASEIAGVVGLERPMDTAAGRIERFLDRSAVSPRRHRWLFGFVLAVVTAIAFDVWHAIREGPWASPAVPAIFGVLLTAGVLAAYLGTVIPLRLLRPHDDR